MASSHSSLLVVAVTVLLTSLCWWIPSISCVSINSFQLPECYSHLTRCEDKIADKAISYFKSKTVLFIGDSLTRYQYLSLCYILRHRRPESAHAYPRIVQENSWGHDDDKLLQWEKFFIGSSALLSPYEKCISCHRHGFFENRVYYDPLLQIRIVYVQFRGNNIDMNRNVDDPNELNLIVGDTGDLRAYFPGINHLDLIVTNVGYFGFHASINPEMYMEKMKSLAKTLVWKTTTYQDGEYADANWWVDHSNAPANRTEMNDVDYRMCNYPDVLCLDTSWTAKHVRRTSYWDTTHFIEPIYAIFNDQLLTLLNVTTKQHTSIT